MKDVDSLKEHLLALAEAETRRVDQKFSDRDTAVQAALAAADKRLDSMNEFRQSLNDTASRTMTRAEVDARLDGIYRQLDELKEARNRVEGKSSGIAAGWSVLVSVLSMAGSIIAVVLALAG
jgi:chlorite dismutase